MSVKHIRGLNNEGARLGDAIEIRPEVEAPSDFRAIFHQSVWRPGGDSPLVEGVVQLVCIDPENKLVPLPAFVKDEILASGR